MGNKSKVQILIGKDIYSLEDAAFLHDMKPSAFLNLVNRSPNGFKFKNDGEIIKRLDKPVEKVGTELERLSDHKHWKSIKDLSIELNISSSWIATCVRKNQQFKYNGEIYVALNYKVVKRSKLKEKAEKIEIIPTENKVLTKPETFTKPVTTTEQYCVDMLKKLAYEHIQNEEYDKVSKVMNALGALKK